MKRKSEHIEGITKPHPNGCGFNTSSYADIFLHSSAQERQI